MSETLKIGDPVMLVWACCANGRRHLGWTGDVEGFWTGDNNRCFCGYATNGLHAWINIEGRGVVPMSWLKKMPPKTELEGEKRDTEVTA